MDGRGRFLQPVMVGSKPASASLPAVVKSRLPVPVRPDRRRHGIQVPRHAGLAGMGMFFSTIAIIGAIQGGHLSAVSEAYGAFHHFAARSLGFGINRITISGHLELSEAEILQATGITASTSLPFADIVDIRQRILALPLVQTASVRKLYPNDLAIDITEREAFAIWQKEGALHVVASDGTATEKFNDARFINLPLVVGEGANKRVKDYATLIDAVPDLKARIRAGVLVSERRWNLKMTNGVDVKLPEDRPDLALARLSVLQRDQKILDRDVLSVDMRLADRITVRLATEPAEMRLDAAKKKMGKWQGSDA